MRQKMAWYTFSIMLSRHKRTPGVPVIKIPLFLAIVLIGAYLRISAAEWGMIFIAAGLVIGAEGMYFVVTGETDPKSYHPFAHNTKDIAAGAVVTSMLAAVIVWLYIFFPYLY